MPRTRTLRLLPASTAGSLTSFMFTIALFSCAHHEIELERTEKRTEKDSAREARRAGRARPVERGARVGSAESSTELKTEGMVLDLSGGPCAMDRVDLEIRWEDCGSVTACYRGLDPRQDRGRVYLRTPVLGMFDLGQHLVTNREPFPMGRPASSTDELARHFETTRSATGYAMDHRATWSPPRGQDGSFGQNATGRAVPVDAEAWYVALPWATMPPPDARVLVQRPGSPHAVVGAAGYEIGPDTPERVGVVSEEIFAHLGVESDQPLRVGFLRDRTVPFGPIECALSDLESEDHRRAEPEP